MRKQHKQRQRIAALVAAAATALAVLAATPASAEELRGPLGYVPGVEDIPGNPGAFGNYLGIPDAGTSWRASGSVPLDTPVYIVGVPLADGELSTGWPLINPQPRQNAPWVAIEPAFGEFGDCLNWDGTKVARKALKQGKHLVRLPQRIVERCAQKYDIGSIATAEVLVGMREDYFGPQGLYASWRDIPTDVLLAVDRLSFHGYRPAPGTDPVWDWIYDSYQADRTAYDNQPHIVAAREAAEDAKWREWAMKGIEWRVQCNTDPSNIEQWKACNDAWAHGPGVQRYAEITAAGLAAADAAGAGADIGWPQAPERAAERALHQLR